MGQLREIVNKKTLNFQSFSSHFFSFSQSTNSNWSIYIPLHSLHLISFPIVFTSKVFMPPLIQKYAVKTPYVINQFLAIALVAYREKIECSYYMNFFITENCLLHFGKTRITWNPFSKDHLAIRSFI